MGNFREIALLHARRGYPVFPCRPDKRPKAGLTDWENVATVDPDQINKWWDEDPNFLPAIPPGRLGLAVIDVDRHGGQDDGFKSLDDANVRLTTEVFGTSLSGNGMHYWHRHDVGSVNGIYPGVDRKARGGYVVVPYELPLPSDITVSLPEELQGGIKASNVERKFMSSRELNAWLREVGEGEPDEEMWELLEKFQPRGNQQMSVLVAKVVSHAAQGHPGGTYILDRMQEIWVSAIHSSGDPEEEFQANVRSAIEKFGEPVPDTTLEDKWANLLKPKTPDPIDIDALRDSLLQHCLTVRADFLQLLQGNERVRTAFLECDNVAKKIETAEQADNWRVAAKAAMGRVLSRE